MTGQGGIAAGRTAISFVNTTQSTPYGRIRYYKLENPSANNGILQEGMYENCTNVEIMMEMLIKYILKNINGQAVNSPHYPPTVKDLGLD